MKPDLAEQIWQLVTTQSGGQAFTIEHVCAAAVQGAGVDGAGITVMNDATTRELVYGTDPIAVELEELQFTLSQGPCLDAFAGDHVLAGDLDTTQYAHRWPLFSPAAVKAGARAVFALPLQWGAARFGAIDLYRTRPGPLSPTELALVLALTDIAVAVILDRHDGDARNNALPRWWATVMNGDQALVHQAAGMVSEQLKVPVHVAMRRLRSHARASGNRLTEVARAVVQRRLHFTSPD